MSSITSTTTLEELAVLVSRTLDEAGILATLSGGAAVSIYSANAYESADLDFITSAGKSQLQGALRILGFSARGGSRMFEHPDTEWMVEFPPGPLGFGDSYIDESEIPILNTQYGPLRIITPTLCVIDRLAACWYHNDRQTWDQALEVAKRNEVDWKYIEEWSKREKRDISDIEKLRQMTGR